MIKPNQIHFVRYKQRQCTDVYCLVIFLVLLFIYAFLAILAISQGNPKSLAQASDSFGNLCGQNEYKNRPYQFYFDISKCLTNGALSFICPTTKLCVSSCPKSYSHYQLLHNADQTNSITSLYARRKLVCIYDFDPVSDNRTIIQLVRNGLCAPYTMPSEPFLGRCLPSALTNLFDVQNNTNVTVEQINNQLFGIDSLSSVTRIILTDLYKIKESLILFTILACLLALLYMFAVKKLTSFMVSFTIITLILILFITSAFCWYTIYTNQDIVYEHSTIARIIDDFVKLRTLYYIFGIITTFLLLLSVFILLTLYDRIQLSIILLDQGATAVFSVLSTLLWSPLIIILFIILTAFSVYTGMCLSTVGRPIFRSFIDNESVPCIPNKNSTQCLFQQEYGYDSLVLNDTDIITRGVIEFLVDYKEYLKLFNIFIYFWLGAFLFAFDEIVLAGVFSNYYWSKERLKTFFPLAYSCLIIIRYHLGSIAFGSLLIATLRYIRMIIEYIKSKFSQLHSNILTDFILECFSCFIWLFEKFLKFLNKNSYVLIASHGYSFLTATRKAFIFLINNCLRFAVLVHITEWILFAGIIIVCAFNTYFFYFYLQWTNGYEQIIIRWAPTLVILLNTYIITSLFFSVYDMAIKTLFVCFLQDLDENDGSIQRPYVMNNELLRLVQKTNVVEKK